MEGRALWNERLIQERSARGISQASRIVNATPCGMKSKYDSCFEFRPASITRAGRRRAKQLLISTRAALARIPSILPISAVCSISGNRKMAKYLSGLEK